MQKNRTRLHKNLSEHIFADSVLISSYNLVNYLLHIWQLNAKSTFRTRTITIWYLNIIAHNVTFADALADIEPTYNFNCYEGI